MIWSVLEIAVLFTSFLEAFRRIDNFKNHHAFLTFLHGLAVYAIIH